MVTSRTREQITRNADACSIIDCYRNAGKTVLFENRKLQSPSGILHYQQAPTGHGSDLMPSKCMPSKCMPVCLPACLLACLLVCQLVCLLSCFLAFLLSCFLAFLLSCFLAFLLSCFLAFLQTRFLLLRFLSEPKTTHVRGNGRKTRSP